MLSGQNPDFQFDGTKVFNELGHHRRTVSWDVFSNLVTTKKDLKEIWQYIDKLNDIRSLYNNLLKEKFRSLPKQLRKSQNLIKNFKEY